MLTYRRKVVLMSGASCALRLKFPWLAALVVLLAGHTTQALAQEDADDEPFLPGLVANFRDGKGNTASRVDHQLAFCWGETPPDPRLAGGEFRVTWQGRLSIDARGDYRFFLVGAGEAELKVSGKVAVARRPLRSEWTESPAVPLNAEFVPFELSERDIDGDDALLRRYLERIPVIEIDGDEAFELVIDETELRQHLGRVQP